MPLTLCPACRLPSFRLLSDLPCPECREALLVAPPICAGCLGLACSPTECFRPWIRVEGEGGANRFDSVTAAYLSVGPGAAILKAWKRSPNPAIARFLLPEIRAKLAGLPDPRAPLVLIPVPQSVDRRWDLAGGSVWRLCETMLAARGRRDDSILDVLTLESGKFLEPERAQQAKSKGDERYFRRSTIAVRDVSEAALPADASVLLVDDFLTSGATLRSAVAAARKKLETSGGFAGRPIRVGVFVLGFRPTLFAD